MTRPCPGARAVTSRPNWWPPAHTTDCHMHIFGPFDQYPLSPGRTYTPPEATVAMYDAMCASVGIGRTVIVQPSIYGTDNAVTLDAVAALGRHRACAVVVVDSTVTAAELSEMDKRGACGVRFNAVSGNGTPLDQLRELTAKLVPLGWHLQLYCHAEQLLELESVLPTLGLPVVIDHMGGIQAAEGGENSPAFAAMLRLLKGGAWAKLCGYRSSQGFPYADVKAMAQAMIAAAPQRCVWGTDWPHPSLHSPDEVPDDGHLMNLLGEWAPEAAQRQAILVDNPARLYRFS